MNKNIKAGISLVDELMVDITGSLIPGFLFLVILFISVVLPVVIFGDFSISSLEGKEIPGGLFWVILIIILILAYVIGHIYYRADIKKPDKADIKREIGKFINDIKNLYNGDEEELRDTLVMQLRNNIITLNDTCKIVGKFKCWYQDGVFNPLNLSQSDRQNATMAIYWCFCKMCDMATKAIGQNKDDVPIPLLLGILFPEEIYRRERNHNPTKIFDPKNVNSGLDFHELDEDIKHIWNEEYKKPLSTSKKIGVKPIVNDKLLELATSLCILEVQIEIGCISTSDCSFPYTYYYKYLLKRNLYYLLENVTWNSRDSRSKNIINEYKTYMQLFVPEKYAILNKNESHVRMSSSTWHMARVSVWIAIGMTLVTTVLAAVTFSFDCDNIPRCVGMYTTRYSAILAIALPVSIIIFCWFANFRIAKFIHYQRNREIFHTICAYNQCKEIIRHKRNVQSTETKHKS